MIIFVHFESRWIRLKIVKPRQRIAGANPLPHSLLPELNPSPFTPPDAIISAVNGTEKINIIANSIVCVANPPSSNPIITMVDRQRIVLDTFTIRSPKDKEKQTIASV